MEDGDELERPRGSGFKGKRPKNRSLSYKRRRGNGNKKSFDLFRDAVAAGDAPERAAQQATVPLSSSKAARRKILPRKIKSLLENKSAEAAEHAITVSKQAKALEGMAKTKAALADAAVSARQMARETKKEASLEVGKLSAIIQSKDAELAAMERVFEVKIDAQVATAVEKEEVSNHPVVLH